MGIQIITVSVLLNLLTGACILPLLADSTKTSESIAIRYTRSDEIGPRFKKVIQPLKLNYRWKNNGIGEGKYLFRKRLEFFVRSSVR